MSSSSLWRLVAAAVVAACAFALPAAAASAATPSLTLHRGASITDPIATEFAAGDKVTAEAAVTPDNYYTLSVYDPDGDLKGGRGCTASASGKVQATFDIPATTGVTPASKNWRFVIREYGWADFWCVWGSDEASKTFKVKKPQTIAFGALGAKTYGDADVTLNASSTSNEAIAYSLAAGSTGCTLDAGKLELTGVGTCKVTASQTGNAAWLAAAPVTRSFAIGAKQLTGAFTAAHKSYDGTTAATVSDPTLTGVLDGDAVTLKAGSAAFADKDAGTDKDVLATDGWELEGADAGNYLLTTIDAAKANIAKAGLGATGIGPTRAYDGTTTGGQASGFSIISSGTGPASDNVGIQTADAVFQTPGVGTSKQMDTSNFVLSGADAGNYYVAWAQVYGSITPKAITGTVTVADREYDGTDLGTISGGTITAGDVVGDDDVALNGTQAQFADPDVGDDKPVQPFVNLKGEDADNYALTVGPVTADITPKGVTGSFTAADKVFDGTTAATITGRSLDGAIAGEEVTLTGGTATFADAQAGDDKTVTGTGFALAGADQANYALTSVATAKAKITPAPVVEQPQTQPQPQPQTPAPAATQPVQTTVASSQNAAPSKTKLTLTSLKASSTCVTAKQLKTLKLSYKLSKAAKVTFTIAKRNPSMARKTCGKLKTVRSDGKYDDVTTATTAAVAQAAATKKSVAGVNTLTLKSLLGKKTLKPGTYRVLAFATDADGTKTVLKKVVFRVVG